MIEQLSIAALFEHLLPQTFFIAFRRYHELVATGGRLQKFLLACDIYSSRFAGHHRAIQAAFCLKFFHELRQRTERIAIAANCMQMELDTFLMKRLPQ